MAEPHWTSYVGMATGIVGIIVAVISMRRSYAVKALDLRLELGKAHNDLDLLLQGLANYLDFVYQSRLRVFAATGRNQSGEMKLFKENFARDVATLDKLKARLPQRRSSYDGLPPHQLEIELVAIHKHQGEIRKLRQKYDEILESDEERRKEIRGRMEN